MSADSSQANPNIAQNSALHPHVHIARPWIKFLIGFVAGLCAACFPRLTASLAVDNAESSIVMFSTGYIVLSLAFSIMVGLVVMILEWGVAREPRATFMMAIGVPALLTGSLNTTTGVSAAQSATETSAKLADELRSYAEVPILEGSSWEPVSIEEAIEPVSDASLWRYLGIADAHAGNKTHYAAAYDFNPSISIQQSKYFVALDKAETKDDAIAKVKRLRVSIKTARAIKTNQGFMIISSKTPKNKSDAILEALQIKKNTNLQPRLLPVSSQ